MQKTETNVALQPQSAVDKLRRRLIKATGGAIALGLAGPLNALASLRSAPVNGAKIDELRSAIKGTVVARKAPEYESWRLSMAWNYRNFGRYPDLIVQAESEADVVAAINFARENGLQIKTRSGGHSWSGCYMVDSGILLDLSHLQTIDIDAKAKEVTVGAGVLGRNLNERLAEHDLVFPTAHCGMVPLSGFMMGGGIGVNFTEWGGMSAFSIISMEVVTADGKVRHVSETQNPELFWAARGAGPGLFCSVLSFKVKCYDLPQALRTDNYIFPYDELIPTVEMMEEIGPTVGRAGKGVEMLTVVIPNPEKGGTRQVTLISATAFSNTQEEADAMLAPLRDHPQIEKAIAKEVNRHSTIEMLYQDNEVPFPQRRARADNIFTNDIVGATKVLSTHMEKSPSDGNTPVILYMGDLEFSDTAAYSAKGRFYLAGYSQWDKAENDGLNQNWLKNLYNDMQQFASGYYINEYDRETRFAETHRCFKPKDWERIGKLRKKYDPNNVYHNFLEV